MTEPEPDFVFDTSCYLNGWRDHYPPPTFTDLVWELVGSALDDGRIILPREVYREIAKQDDDVRQFIERYSHLGVVPDHVVRLVR